MQPLMGYWQWDPGEARMLRPDGAWVRYRGIDRDRPAPGNRLWLHFDLALPGIELTVPVEQRLIGRDSYYRALWYRVDLRQCQLPFAQWSAVERLIGDALTCWPRGHLIDAMPTGVGIQGGYLQQRWHPDFLRLYQPTYVQRVGQTGELARPPSDRPWSPVTAGGAGYGGAQADFAALARQGLWLSQGEANLALVPDQHALLRLVYWDRDFGTDRYLCSPPYRNQDHIWNVWESPDRFDLTEFGPRPPRGLLDLLRPQPRRDTSRQRKAPPLSAARHERLHAALQEALFSVPEGAIVTERMQSPPEVLTTIAPWRRGGSISLKCHTATTLANEALKSAFCEEPEGWMVAPSPVDPGFDAARGILTGPDGSTLELQAITEPHCLAPRRLLLRCRSHGLDWPVLVERRDRQPPHAWAYQNQTISRWRIDHQACLHAWQAEGHAGLPDPQAWDCLRQFLEDALLSWGDGPAAGPAPQSLLTSGGWYDGVWRGDEFQRLLTRKQLVGADRPEPDQVPWQPYRPDEAWQRQEWTPADVADLASAWCGPTPEKTVPLPFTKVSSGANPARLWASGYRLTGHRDEWSRSDLVDFTDNGQHVRLVGARYRLHATRMIEVGPDSPPLEPDGQMRRYDANAIRPTGLALWRRLRNACESTLEPGEQCRVEGIYVFDRCYPMGLRITALGLPLDETDQRLSGSGQGL